MLNGDELYFLWLMSGRGNGKCAMEREMLKKAKTIKYLKKELRTLYDTACTELDKHRHDKDARQYIRGYQDAVSWVMWIIYEGEHKDEN